jgi:hypothetical protein
VQAKQSFGNRIAASLEQAPGRGNNQRRRLAIIFGREIANGNATAKCAPRKFGVVALRVPIRKPGVASATRKMLYDVPTERNAMASKPKMWRAALPHSVCDSNQHDDDARGIRAHAGNWGRAEVGIPTWRKLAARFPNVPTIRERMGPSARGGNRKRNIGKPRPLGRAAPSPATLAPGAGPAMRSPPRPYPLPVAICPVRF